MKIDSHHHFWNYNEKEFGWIGDDQHVLKQDFLPDDLEPILKSNKFDGSVVVQARQSLAETDWLLQLAERSSFIKGVVGWVDLCSPTVDKQLRHFSSNNLFKGVRHVVHDELDDQFMLRKDFQRGIASLKDYGLTYDLLLFPKHIPFAVELVEAFPKQLFVIDHLAKPDIKNQLQSPWKRDIKRIAAHPNVYCKLSGMVTEANLKFWVQEDFTPYLDVVYQAFGPDRLMIGSDWPVCTLSKEYQVVMGIVEQFIQSLPSAEQERILGGNCAKFYGIDE
ncbi:amidohydrolase family protein [Aquibacillus halophilus]|uniref:Amidohydrolase family protein n=1 Tax=Aquibacillus halophilus TaxID=930132 RepID=A0A6A8D630_9BACI|nr:amidohydrolase family protein [Aquibacillus halophilus]MRH41064.1 amidohydrolase family protein [Aquibacillus halophilus]